MNFYTFVPAIYPGLLCTWRVHDIHVSYISTRRLSGFIDFIMGNMSYFKFLTMTSIHIVVNQNSYTNEKLLHDEF